MFGNVLLFFAARAAARLRASSYEGRHQSVPACRPSVHSQAPYVRGQDGQEGCQVSEISDVIDHGVVRPDINGRRWKSSEAPRRNKKRIVKALSRTFDFCPLFICPNFLYFSWVGLLKACQRQLNFRQLVELCFKFNRQCFSLF